MACYFPWSQSLGSATRPVSCGQCIGCRLEYSRQWAVRIMHEAQLHERNSFVTLTYRDPAPVSLQYRDYQLFQKRLVKARGACRYYVAGEYGENFGRPHFHAVLFGLGFDDQRYLGKSGAGFKLYRSDSLSELWRLGHASVGAVTFESAAYVARYVMKKVTGPLAESHYQGREPEFSHMSNGGGKAKSGGIGYHWLQAFGKSDVLNDGRVIVNGHKCNAPRYYRQKLAALYPRQAERLAAAGHAAIVNGVADSSDSRLAAKEQVKRASLDLLKRNL